MIQIWKQKFCKHDFKLAKAFIDDADMGLGYKPTEFVVIYCPKCKKEKTVTRFNFEVMSETKRIDKEYGQRFEQKNADALDKLEREIDNRESGR